MFSELPTCELLENRRLLSAAGFSNASLIGTYLGSATVTAGGVKATAAAEVVVDNTTKNSIEVEGNILGYTFEETMYGKVNAKTGKFSFSKLANDDSILGAFKGCITCTNGVTLLTGGFEISFITTTPLTQITIDGTFQLDQIFTLAAPDSVLGL